MTTYSNLAIISLDATFQARTAYAMMTAAVAIYNEAVGVAGHVQRKAYASQVLAGNYNLYTATLSVLTNSTISASATMTPTPGANVLDTDIQNAVNSVWNALAGA